MDHAAEPELVLASASPRRSELLAGLGLRFSQQAADIDERWQPGESPEHYVERLALEKARAIAVDCPAAVVLGSDTTVVLDGEPLGKPADEAEACAMLAALSGREHEVLTAIAVVGPQGEKSRVVATKVRFRPLSEAEIRAYWRSGEPADKAGAYGIQGLAAIFVERLEGSYSAVVGLPLAETAALLKEFEITVLA